MTRKKHSTSSARKCPLPPTSKPHLNNARIPQAGRYSDGFNWNPKEVQRADKPINILWVYKRKWTSFSLSAVPNLTILLSLGGDKFLWLDKLQIISLDKGQGENLVQLKGMVDSIELRDRCINHEE